MDADPTASVELLSNPISETFWPRFCKMLETTRRRRLRDQYRAWCKQNNRKITRAPEKRRIAATFPPTTLFDDCDDVAHLWVMVRLGVLVALKPARPCCFFQALYEVFIHPCLLKLDTHTV